MQVPLASAKSTRWSPPFPMPSAIHTHRADGGGTCGSRQPLPPELLLRVLWGHEPEPVGDPSSYQCHCQHE